MRLFLRDRNQQLCDAWHSVFANDAAVEISCGEIFEGPSADAVVSPANSFGFMDGGIDLAYAEHFGWELETRLKAKLKSEHYGELPVGQAVIVETNNARIPFMISAPTMRLPTNVANTPNAYLALRAALVAAKQRNVGMIETKIETILCPGLASAIGAMPPPRVAQQMHLAWNIVVHSMPWPPATAGLVHRFHREITGA
jgi:O-acetyl-ADP-ribose deacetylase (regulator of RNase III)